MRFSTALVLGALCAGALSFTKAEADSIAVPNFSFEDNTADNSNFNGSDYYGDITDWVKSGNFGVGGTLADRFGYSPSADLIINREAFFNLTNGPAYLTTASPVTTIIAGTDYLMTVAVANTPDTDTNDFGDPGTLILNILATSSLPGSNPVVAASYTIPEGTIPNGMAENFSAELTPVLSTLYAGDALSLQIEAYNATDTTNFNYQPLFDNVRLDTVPEPSTWVMLLGGLGMLVFVQRRRSSNI
jgi:hypothetical protein